MVESGVLDLAKPRVRQYLLQKLDIGDAEMMGESLNKAEACVRVICRELGLKPIRIEEPKKLDDPKKIVSEDELERCLTEGWDVQTVLPSGKILIKRTG